MLERDIKEFCEELEKLLRSGRELLQQIREQDEKGPLKVILEIPSNTFEMETGEFRSGSALIRIVDPDELGAPEETDE